MQDVKNEIAWSDLVQTLGGLVKHFIIVMLAASAMFGCSRDDKADPIGDIVEKTEEKDLQNRNFTSACGAATPLNMPNSRMIYRFGGANVVRTIQMFTTADCSGDAAIRFDERGDFDVNPNNVGPDGGKDIDFNYTSLRVTTLTSDGVKIANAMQLCSANDWSVNSERDQTAHAGEVNCFSAQVPRKNVNLYRVDGNNLFLGASSDKDTTERPIALDMSVPYAAP